MSPRRHSHLLMGTAATTLLVGSVGMNLAYASTVLEWSKLGDGVAYPAGGQVYDLALSTSDDTLYAVGSFATVQQQSGASLTVENVARWRASDDTWLPMGKGTESGGKSAFAVATGATDLVYVGGNFTFLTQRTDDTVASPFVARWRSTDDTWLPMGRGVGTCTGSCRVATVAPSANDDTVYVGGNFEQAFQRTGQTIAVNRVAQWQASDDTWLPMGKGVGTAGGVPVRSIAVGPGDDTVFVGGEFTFATQRTDDTIVANAIAQWRAADDTWLPMGSGLQLTTGGPKVNDIAVQGELVYVAGGFQVAGGVPTWGLAVYNMTTGLWAAGPGMASTGPWNTVPLRSIVTLPGGRLLVMTEVSGVQSDLYLWDGSSWTSVGSVRGTMGTSVQTLVTDDTTVYLGGLFNSIGPTSGSMSTITSISRGAFASSPTPPAPPTPDPVYAPGAPTQVTATAEVEEASVSWTAPSYAGSFPITDYQATSSPGGKSCLVKAPSLSCTVTGLTAGTTYTFTARALNGAGWGAYSDRSNAVTPTAPARPSIVISGSRDAADPARIRVTGITMGMVGERVTPFVRFPGQPEATAGTGVQTVAADGTFTWSRKTGKKTYVYFQHASTRSHTVVIPAR